MRHAILYVSIAILFSCSAIKDKNRSQHSSKETKPNIIIIYADDLGYGDVGAYGATALKTPNMDKLAHGGIQFTNGYSTSATCTPSRYALLTGDYPWRNKDARILPGTAPLLIDTNQMTMPKMLSESGYQTGIVGKWHLGLGTGHVNWNERVNPGPNELGFDYSYIMAATQDRVPTVYIENGYVVNLDESDPISIDYGTNFPGEPTGINNPDLLKMIWHHGHNNSIVNGIPRIGFMKGGQSAKWKDEDMADQFLEKAQEYIQKSKKKPFFLYYALQQPHVPRTPHPRFEGTTGLGPRGDVIAEADWCIGELLKTLEEEDLLENTLIILSSDNGPVLNDGYYDDAVEKLGNHNPFGPFRGGKYSLFEAGTRVPFISYWKGKIEAQKSDALVCQIDFFNSLAALVGSDYKTFDSKDLSKTFLGKKTKGRKELILEASAKTAFKQGDYVLIPPYSGQPVHLPVNIELGNSDEYQLYNIKEDIGQQNNLAKSEVKKLEQMIRDFESIRGKSYGQIEKIILN